MISRQLPLFLLGDYRHCSRCRAITRWSRRGCQRCSGHRAMVRRLDPAPSGVAEAVTLGLYLGGIALAVGLASRP